MTNLQDADSNMSSIMINEMLKPVTAIIVINLIAI